MSEGRIKTSLACAIFNAYWKVFNAAPKDTWNLARNALQLVRTAAGYVIYVDPVIAPYMVYTEEPWISPRWGGKKNPNEGWFKNVVDDVAHYLAQVLGGKAEVING